MKKEELIQTLKEKAMTQDSITYDMDTFNAIIYPNKLIKLYDKTYNALDKTDPKDRRKHLWKKPSIVPISKDGKFLIKKGHIYFGYGYTNLIYINGNMIPKNGKPFEEPITKEYMREYALRSGINRKFYHTELWMDEE